jgi:hypothetical protein
MNVCKLIGNQRFLNGIIFKGFLRFPASFLLVQFCETNNRCFTLVQNQLLVDMNQVYIPD